MAHVPSTLPRGSGERENAIFQAIGATVGSSSRPGERQEVTPEILAGQRLGHQVSVRGPCAHASQRMRDELTAALQARWEESLADEAADGAAGVGEVEEGIDDFLAALVAALQPVEGVVPGVSPACPGCRSRP
jgi:hypothetical protein